MAFICLVSGYYPERILSGAIATAKA